MILSQRLRIIPNNMPFHRIRDTSTVILMHYICSKFSVPSRQPYFFYQYLLPLRYKIMPVIGKVEINCIIILQSLALGNSKIVFTAMGKKKRKKAGWNTS